jgi:Polyketide cyclase / dehydrase and lipid transport
MRRMPSVATTVQRTIAVGREPLFARFIAVDLPDILKRYGPVPAVARTSGQTGPWDVVGSSRTVHLSDGSSATERVTACEAPRHFGYTVSGFTNPVRLLAGEARGQWSFDPDPDADGGGGGEATRVRWTYAFEARSRPAALLLAPVVKLAWRGYMRRALTELDRLARA